MLLAMAACALLGIVIEKLAYRPLRSRPKLTVLITAIGVSLLLEYGGQFLLGADPKSFPDLIEDSSIEIYRTFYPAQPDHCAGGHGVAPGRV